MKNDVASSFSWKLLPVTFKKQKDRRQSYFGKNDTQIMMSTKAEGYLNSRYYFNEGFSTSLDFSLMTFGDKIIPIGWKSKQISTGF